jgi:hypothetical protein
MFRGLFFLCSLFLYVLSSSCCVSILFFSAQVFFLRFPLYCLMLLAIILAESSCWLQTCNRDTVCRLVFTLPIPTVGSWWSQWASCDREVTIIHVTCGRSQNKWEIVTMVHTASENFLFFCYHFVFVVLSFIYRFASIVLEVFLWLEKKFKPCSGFLRLWL